MFYFCQVFIILRSVCLCNGAHDVCEQLLVLFLSLYHIIEHQCVNRTRTDDVDADLAVFQIDSPSAGERPYGCFGCVVNTKPLEPVAR